MPSEHPESLLQIGLGSVRNPDRAGAIRVYWRHFVPYLDQPGAPAPGHLRTHVKVRGAPAARTYFLINSKGPVSGQRLIDPRGLGRRVPAARAFDRSVFVGHVTPPQYRG